MDIKLTDNQKLYIKDNLSKQSPMEIAKCLQIDSEIVCNFIIDELTDEIIIPSQFEGLDIFKDTPFGLEFFESLKTIPYSIKFELTEKADVEVNIEWSNNASSKEFIENVGILLHMIHNGKMKSMIGQSLTLLAQEKNMEEEVLGAISKWKELDGLDGSEPCINPYEVF